MRRSSISSGGARRDRTDDLMLAKHALSQLSYGPVPEDECLWLSESGLPSRSARQRGPPSPSRRAARWRSGSGSGAAAFAALRARRLVGLGRLELPTSRLSSARSNQLSYKPLTTNFLKKDWSMLARTGLHQMRRTNAAPGACSSAKKEKRRRRNPAN